MARPPEIFFDYKNYTGLPNMIEFKRPLPMRCVSSYQCNVVLNTANAETSADKAPKFTAIFTRWPGEQKLSTLDDDIYDELSTEIEKNQFIERGAATIGEANEFIADFRQIVSKAMDQQILREADSAPPPHPNGPTPVDESIYGISNQQRDATEQEKLEFSLFSKMIFPNK